MADKKITELELGTPQETDFIPFVDTSDTSMGLDGTTKKAYKSDLKGDTGDNATVDVGNTITLAPGSPATVVNVGTTSDAILDFGIPAGSVIYSTIGLPDNSIGMDGDWAFSTTTTSNVYYKSGGAWALVNSNKGVQGDTGNGIVSIILTGTVGLVDTYTITYDDASTSTFDVTNGAQGDPGVDGLDITWLGAYSGATAYVPNDAVSYNGSSYICKLATTGNLPTNTTYWDLMAAKGTDGEGSGDMLASVYDPANKASQVEVIANKSTNVVTDAASDEKYPSVKAVKTYADGLVAGLLDYRGAYDASVNTFPASGGSGTAGVVMKGDMWIISVAGTLGGTAVQIGDSVIANVDTPGQTSGNWNVLNSNISYVPEDVANKSTNVTTDGASDIKYPSVKAVKTHIDSGVSTMTNKTLNDLTNYIDGDALHLKVFLNLGGASTIGMPVYSVTWNAANTAVEIGKARANAAGTMPCVGLMETAGADGTVGSVRVSGLLINVDTSAWSEGAALYVSAASAGVLTVTKPTGVGDLVQRIGTVIRQHATLGIIEVMGAGRSNDVPNTINMVGAINEAKGADIASGSSIDIGAGTGNMIDITGTTTITALGTIQAGTRRILRFTGALILTHNATSLILPTGANIITVAGDTATMVSLGSGNWVCTSYQRKDGSALLSGSSNFPLSISTIFENLSRFNMAASNFSQTITATGLYQEATVVSGQQWARCRINGYKSKSFLGNPTIAACFYLNSQASQTGKEIYFGTGKVANGVGHTFTERHIGFKMIQVGGVMQIRGTQSDGTTEVTTAVLGSLSNDEKVYMKAIINSVSGSVYYEVRIGTTTNSASLTTNFPTNVDASDEALLQFSMDTRSAWDGFYGYWVSGNYIRQ